MGNKNMPNVDGVIALRPSRISSVVAIAINGSKKSKYLIKWAFEKLIPEGGPEQVCFKLIHVFPVISVVPTPLGTGLPISQVRDDVAAAYRKELEWQTSEKLLPYKMWCIRRKVQVEVVQIESDDIAIAIAEQIAKFNINKLVIGASSMSGMLSRTVRIGWLKGQDLSSKISECCTTFCTIYAVSKGKLSSVRPSDPEAVPVARNDTIDTHTLSNYTSSNTINSQPGIICLKFLEGINSLFNALSLMFSRVDWERLSHFVSSFANEAVSACFNCEPCSDITDQKSKESSFRTDGHSWTTDQSSSLNASADFSSQFYVSSISITISCELEQLRMELRHVQQMYAKARNEAIDASRKLNDLHNQRLEETIKLKEMSLRIIEAKELAEQQKEAALRTAAEKEAIRDAKAREKLENSLTNPVHHYEEFTWDEIVSATSSFSSDF
ncbi:hypothetical protein CDL12_20686 [Handroanthus impetiginosus]|uniref:RING-type E3 ubiquitin transferase n=1 Tax=Handroanthus impetiginosus TaxID=429701 RepID=A0A2G9GN99_9LAMI|nr:hypothetical protein CDL12_20686 [Handroanthus impetiginosus]